FVWAFWHYQKYFKGKVDLVIDQIHWVPFFTPLYVKEPKVALIFEIAKNLWDKSLPRPLSTIGHKAEYLYLRLYRQIPFLTASQSTYNELKAAKIQKVTTFPLAPNLNPSSLNWAKEKLPTFISLSRLTPAKQIEETIKAFYLLSQKVNARLWIVGRGESRYKNHLIKLAREFGLESKISFWGYIDEKKKAELLQRAWAIISTSAREGWGLNITEAGVLGTPAVVYNSPGLRDAVRHKKTGLICQKSTPEELERKLNELIHNSNLRMKLGRQAQILNQKLTWDKSAKITLDVLKNIALQRANN
ncbi:MAG: hypothetical protein DRI56_09385, partial [Chloroflexota bacterium]